MTLLHYKLWQQEKELATQVLKTQQKIQLLGSLAIFSIPCESCKHFQLKIVWEWLTTISWKYGHVGLNTTILSKHFIIYASKQTFDETHQLCLIFIMMTAKLHYVCLSQQMAFSDCGRGREGKVFKILLANNSRMLNFKYLCYPTFY